MSQLNSVEPPLQPTLPQPAGTRPKINVYTMMLIIAFLALSIACLLLYLELRRWGSFPWWRTVGGPGVTAPVHTGVADLRQRV